MDVVRTFRAVATVSRWRTTTLVACICAGVTSQTELMVDHFGPCTGGSRDIRIRNVSRYERVIIKRVRRKTISFATTPSGDPRRDASNSCNNT